MAITPYFTDKQEWLRRLSQTTNIVEKMANDAQKAAESAQSGASDALAAANDAQATADSAQAAASAAQADIDAHLIDYNNPHQVTKAQLGVVETSVNNMSGALTLAGGTGTTITNNTTTKTITITAGGRVAFFVVYASAASSTAGLVKFNTVQQGSVTLQTSGEWYAPAAGYYTIDTGIYMKPAGSGNALELWAQLNGTDILLLARVISNTQDAVMLNGSFSAQLTTTDRIGIRTTYPMPNGGLAYQWLSAIAIS